MLSIKIGKKTHAVVAPEIGKGELRTACGKKLSKKQVENMGYGGVNCAKCKEYL